VSTPTRLLLAEDDPTLADALSANLRQAGFEVVHADNGAVAEYLLLNQPFDLGIIDLGLPMVDGLTVLKRAHAARPALPLLILTALDSLESRVAGLNAGADDYLTKPFDFPELEARVGALLRRARLVGAPARQPVQTSGQLSFDREGRRAAIGGTPVDLSPREWLLLDLLLTHEGKVVTKEQIGQAWAGEGNEPGTVAGALEVYIHRLRRKLEGSGLGIRTVRGLGYLLEAAG